jgi:hypothetical protein
METCRGLNPSHERVLECGDLAPLFFGADLAAQFQLNL